MGSGLRSRTFTGPPEVRVFWPMGASMLSRPILLKGSFSDSSIFRTGGLRRRTFLGIFFSGVIGVAGGDAGFAAAFWGTGLAGTLAGAGFAAAFTGAGFAVAFTGAGFAETAFFTGCTGAFGGRTAAVAFLTSADLAAGAGIFSGRTTEPERRGRGLFFLRPSWRLSSSPEPSSRLSSW